MHDKHGILVRAAVIAAGALDIILQVIVFAPEHGLGHHDFTADEDHIALGRDDDDIAIFQRDVADLLAVAQDDDAFRLHSFGPLHEFGDHLRFLGTDLGFFGTGRRGSEGGFFQAAQAVGDGFFLAFCHAFALDVHTVQIRTSLFDSDEVAHFVQACPAAHGEAAGAAYGALHRDRDGIARGIRQQFDGITVRQPHAGQFPKG